MAPHPVTRRPVVLASGSRYRAGLLRDAGYVVEVDPPEVDERALDHLLADAGAAALALTLARAKADVVAARHPGALVVAGDQVGVLATATGPRQLTKQPTVAGAVEQLLALSGTTHELVNGVAVVDGTTDRRAEGVDVQVVTVRTLSRSQAGAYVEHFEPFDTAGSYRLEDGAAMPVAGTGPPFVSAVVGEHDSGVLGLPLPLLGRLLAEVLAPR